MSYVIMILVAPALMLGFTVASCMSAAVSENTYWMLGAGLASCLVLPAIVASWLRSLRSQRVEKPDQGGASRPVQPSGFPSGQGTVLLFNLLILAGSALLAPAQTRSGLKTHGGWWARSLSTLLPKDRGEALVIRVEGITQWLAEVAIPSVGAVAPGQRSEVSPAPGDGGGGSVVELAPDAAVPRNDGLPDPTAGDEVQVAFKRQGSGIVVPVRLGGPKEVRVKMLFDTGATLTTIDSRTLNRLGLALDPRAPQVMSQTANGRVRRPITVLDSAAMGDAVVDGGITVAICDPCASGEVVGLLGLNYARHFRFTVDHETGTLGLQPKLKRQSRLQEIQHFVKLRQARGVWTGSLLSIRLKVDNLAPRALRNIQVTAEVTQDRKVGRLHGSLRAVPARSTVALKMQGVVAVHGEQFKLRLTRADW